MKKHWHLLRPDPAQVKVLCRELGCTPVTAAILCNRDIRSAQQAWDFINPTLGQVRAPFALKDMAKAVERLVLAIQKQQSILIFGDYDADGVTSVVLLLEFLQYVKANVTYYIPDRNREGYSLKAAHIESVAKVRGVDLVVTVDCGSASHDAAAAASAAGIDVMITDHHEIECQPSGAFCVVNPKQTDCPGEMAHLAGVGVVFCLVICLRKRLRDLGFWQHQPEPNLKQWLDLVALGTIADMVPLVRENRIFAKIGMALIDNSTRPGINALKQAAGIRQEPMDADDIAFKLAPRINAAGRMSHAGKAVELLTTNQPQIATRIANELNEANQLRQETEAEMLAGILSDLQAAPHLVGRHSIVLANSAWHPGVVGLLAAKLTERFYRPTVLIALDGELGRASARSIEGFDLHQGLKACAHLLESYGGHAMAAGLVIRPENIAAFREGFDKAVRAATRPDDFTPVIVIDHELYFEHISDQLIDELESLMPFGTANPEPVFMAADVKVLNSKILGTRHRRLFLKQTGTGPAKTFGAIWFNIDPELPAPQKLSRIAFNLRWNRWKGAKSPQMVIKA